MNNDLIVKKLEWDELNIAHIARHTVSPEEVAEVCQREPVVKEGHENRLFVIGSTNTGRMLTIILKRKKQINEYRPITAYDASKTSIQTYQAEKRKGGEAA